MNAWLNNFTSLMNRNLDHKSEICTPPQDPALAEALIAYFSHRLCYNDKSVTLIPGIKQEKQATGLGPGVNAKQSIYNYLLRK